MSSHTGKRRHYDSIMTVFVTHPESPECFCRGQLGGLRWFQQSKELCKPNLSSGLLRTEQERLHFLICPIWHVSIMFDDLWSSPWLSKCVFFTLLIADFAQSLAMLTLFGLQESFAQLHFGPNLGLKRLLGGSTMVTHTLQKSCGDPPSKTSVGTSLKKGH